MGAVVAAGVALSPVIATLGVGLGGLGLAALGVAKNQELMRRELAPLKAEFAAFYKALQPVVLQDLGGGAGHRPGRPAHDLQPVAQATGKALGGVLGQIGRELQSGTWKRFLRVHGGHGRAGHAAGRELLHRPDASAAAAAGGSCSRWPSRGH